MVDITKPGSWDLVAEGYADFATQLLEPFAADALDWAAVARGERVLDVAAGPGTLTLQAVRRGAQVAATDFSPGMVATLRERARKTVDASGLVVEVADGQNLPYPDQSFDAGFSMFGLFMFPDRARGFAELHRVLRPGGRAVVSSWSSFPDEHPFTLAHAVLREQLAPDAPVIGEESGAELPLATEAALLDEMGAAGFEVEVRALRHGQRYASLDELFARLLRSHVGYAAAATELPRGELEQLHGRLFERLRAALEGRELVVEMFALLALGRKSG